MGKILLHLVLLSSSCPQLLCKCREFMFISPLTQYALLQVHWGPWQKGTTNHTASAVRPQQRKPSWGFSLTTWQLLLDQPHPADTWTRRGVCSNACGHALSAWGSGSRTEPPQGSLHGELALQGSQRALHYWHGRPLTPPAAVL